MRRAVRRTEPLASLVVFLVALPLCVGLALASGVPAELGLVTGTVGASAASLMRLGRWFRVVPVAVVRGLLAGIGIVLVTGQMYSLGDTAVPASGLGKVTGLVSQAGAGDPVALSVGVPPWSWRCCGGGGGGVRGWFRHRWSRWCRRRP